MSSATSGVAFGDDAIELITSCLRSGIFRVAPSFASDYFPGASAHRYWQAPVIGDFFVTRKNRGEQAVEAAEDGTGIQGFLQRISTAIILRQGFQKCRLLLATRAANSTVAVPPVRGPGRSRHPGVARPEPRLAGDARLAAVLPGARRPGSPAGQQLVRRRLGDAWPCPLERSRMTPTGSGSVVRCDC